MQSRGVQFNIDPLSSFAQCALRIAWGVGALALLSAQAHGDWVDEMPDVGDVAAVIAHEYDHGPEDQSTTAINLAAALILLRQLSEYRMAEDPTLSADHRARIQAVGQSYLFAEFAIGRNPGARRGALSEDAVRQFYESRRYEKCATADCYRYWMAQQLEFWGAAKFRERILPLLFPCGDAPELLALAGRHALEAPLVPATPALTGANDLAQAQAATDPLAAQACDPEGVDVDGDGLCLVWESKLKTRMAADGDAACRITLTDVHMQDPSTLRVTFANAARYVGTEIRFRVARGASDDMAAALEDVPSQPATIVSGNAADPRAAYAVVSLDTPLSITPLPADPKTPLPFVLVDVVKVATRGPVICEQPMRSWLPRHQTPVPRGLHGPYSTLNEALAYDLASFIAYVNTYRTFPKLLLLGSPPEVGFLIVRDVRLANGGYYTTPPRLRQGASVSPLFEVQDYDASLHQAFEGSCESLNTYVVVMPVHTHPAQAPNAMLSVDNFTMIDFNMAIRMFIEGIDDQGRYVGVNFHWGADGGHPTRLEGIGLVNARNACVMRFTPLAGDAEFPAPLPELQQMLPWLSTDDYEAYTARTNTLVPIAGRHPSGTLGQYVGDHFVTTACDGQ